MGINGGTWAVEELSDTGSHGASSVIYSPPSCNLNDLLGTLVAGGVKTNVHGPYNVLAAFVVCTY